MTATELTGLRPALVHDAVLGRRKARKLGLVVEGGGMRGAISAGSLLALDTYRATPTFDAVYAISAGAVNSAFLLSGQGREGIRIYFEHMNNRRFLNPLRLWRMVDVDWIYDHVIPRIIGLDQAAIAQQPTRLMVGVTDCSSGKAEFVDARHPGVGLLNLLKASAAMPVFYNRPVKLEQRMFLDGGIFSALPLMAALADGCSDIVCAFTRPRGYASSRPSRFESVMFWLMLGNRYPNLSESFAESWKRNNAARRQAEGQPPLEEVNILLLAPGADHPAVERLTVDPARLFAAASAAALATTQLFGWAPAAMQDVLGSLRARHA